MKYTLDELNEMMERNGGSLYLEGCTGLTSLPEGLTVGGDLDLRGCTGLTSLPEGLTVGGDLYLEGCTISNPRAYKHLRDGVADLQFKAAKDRGAEQYRGIDMDKPMPVEDCMVMYRTITGACRAGTQAFVDGIEDLREAYTVREIIGMVDGAYGGETFRRFFEEEDE